VRVAVHHQGARWQISGIEDLDKTLDAIDNAQQERLIVANRPIESQLQDLVGVGSPDIAQIAHGRYRTSVRLRLRIDNKSTTTLRAIDLALSTRSSDDEHAAMLHVDGPIPAGQAVMAEWSFDDARRGSSRTAFLLLHPSDLTLRARRVVMDSSGVADDTVRLFKSYRQLRRRNS
jgi:hypothetical protein